MKNYENLFNLLKDREEDAYMLKFYMNKYKLQSVKATGEESQEISRNDRIIKTLQT